MIPGSIFLQMEDLLTTTPPVSSGVPLVVLVSNWLQMQWCLLQMQWLHQLLLMPRQDTMYSYFFDMESDDTSFGEFQAYMS